MLTWVALLLPGKLLAQSPGGAFSCDGTFYQIKQPQGQTTSSIFTIDRSSATYATVPLNVNAGSNNLGVLLNGLAYNSQDGYMYALTTPGATGSNANTPVRLYKIGLGGAQLIGTITLGGTNLAITPASGTFDKTGNYYFTAQNTGGTNDFSVYRLAPGSATPTVVTRLTPSQNVTLYDIAFNPIDGFIYGANFVGSLYRFNQGTNALTVVTNSPAANQNTANAVGTVFFDIAGNMYAYSNGTVGTANSSQFYEVDLTTGLYTPISTIDPASVSDGASCINPGKAIDVTKEVTNVKTVSASSFDITYVVRVRNTYTTTIDNVQVSDLLKGNLTTSTNVPFPTATSISIVSAPVVTNFDGAALAANPNYTGLSPANVTTLSGGALLSGNQSLTAGQRALITYTIRVAFANAASVPTTPRNNTAYGTSTSAAPNRGYTLTSTDVLLTPNDLVADDASTNSSEFPDLRTVVTNGTPVAVDTPAPTPITFSPSISGTVFEDVNYGGGAGRTQSAGTGVSIAGVRVELYRVNAGVATYSTAVNTAADGSYSFTGLTAGASYVVRVVNNTVTSSRTGAVAGLLPVQTYRTQVTAADGTLPDPNRVGGEDPSRTDAANGTTATTLTLLNNPVAGTIAQSQAPITLAASAPAVNVDFGYNFDLVVNTNDAGQGSLRQFITNANALGDEATLAQSGSNAAGALPASVESSIFMIPDGLAHAGQVAGLPSGINGTGGNANAAVITLASSLPTLTGANTRIDATTQTFNIGNTNTGTVGTGGTVGVDGLTLNTVAQPEVAINANNLNALVINANASAVKGLAIYNAANTAGAGAITVGGVVTGAANRAELSQLLIGTLADGTDPGAALRNRFSGIQLNGAFNITNNYFGYNGEAISIANRDALTAFGNNAALVTNNEFNSNGGGTSSGGGIGPGDNISILDASGVQISGNLMSNSQGTGSSYTGKGVEVWYQATGNTIANNTITGSSVAGIGLSQGAFSNTISRNIISGTVGTAAANTGPGILMSVENLGGAGGLASPLTNTITQNNIFNNHGLAIDLANGSSLGDGVTVNDNGDADNGPNGQANYPVITSATISGGTLYVKGFARAGSVIELFNAGATADASGFGEGQTYLGSVTEGSAADLDNTTNQSYSGIINGLNQGSDNSANGFSFAIPVSSLTGGTLAVRTILSSTATVGGATSEFSGNIIVRDLTVANDDQATTPLNTPVTFAVTGNDTPNADINTLTIDLDPNTAGIQTSFTVTGEGTFTTVGVTAGSVKFTPTSTFVGVSNTPYTVQNASGATSNQANLIVKVETQLDLATTIATSTPTVVAGNAVTLTGTFSNNSLTGTTANVVQKVLLPIGLTGNITVSINGGATSTQAISPATTSTGVFTFGTQGNFPAGSTANYSLTFNAPLGGSFTATAFVEPTAGDINLANNSASVNVTVTPKLDLFTTITGPSGVLPQNSLFNYTVTTGNTATSSPATGVVQTVEVPASSLITGVFATNGGVYNAAAGTVTFPPVDLAAGQVVTNTVSFVVPATNITVNAVRATVPTTNDVATGNNAATASSVSTQTVAAVDPRANLYTVISGPAQANPGAATQYTVQQGNNGPNAASNVKTTVSAPAGLGVAGITVGGTSGTLSGNTITFGSGATYDVTTGILTFPTIGSQANGAAEQSYVFTITPSGATQSIALTASVSSATADNVPANNMSTVATEIKAVTDIAVTVTNASGAGSLTAGQTAIYEVQTQNIAASGLSALDVQQRVSLPAGLSAATLKLNGATGTLSGFVITFGSGATASTYNVNTGLLTLPLVGTLPKGALLTNTISFPVSGTSTGTGVRVLASATTSTPESDLTNNSAAATGTGINSVEDLVVAISGPTQALNGNPVLYTVTTTNNGPSSTGTVSTVVQLPIGLTSVEVRDNTGTVLAGAYSATTGLVTYPTTTTMPTVGQSVQGTISFIAPDANQISLAASVGVTSPSTGNSESNIDNNSARISTLLAAPSLGSTDLVTTITPQQSGNIAPNASVGFTVVTNNASAVVAQNPTQLVTLPVGLSAASLFVGGQPGTLSAGVITFPSGATYNVSTGLLTVSLGTSLNNGASASTSISYPMPAADVTLTAISNSTNPESTPANNIARTTTPTGPFADIVLGVSGPTLATSGSTVSYSVLATNAGPSTASSVTVRFTLPAGVSSYTVNGTVTPITTTTGPTQVTLFPSSNTLQNGASLSYQVSFAAPSASFSVASTVSTTTTGDDPGNNNGTVNTNVNIAPLANDVVNALQTPEGNTATAKLPLTPLSATDTDGTVASYKLTSLPNSGTLYYNGTPVAINTAYTNPALFSFTPTAGFVGSVFFTYTATDNGNGVTANALTSPAARYTIQVGQDNNSVYTATPAKGGSNKYVTNDALAFVIDQNGAVYNNAPTTGLVYNPNGTVATGTVANGLPTTGTNAVLAPSGSGPAGNTTNVLPSGVSLNPTTGLIFVSNAAALPLVRAATTYSVNVITTDVNGGTNTVLATFTIGAYPLPVELSAFTAVAKNLDAQLAWTTASEKDNDHFDVERSLNGTDFVKIAEVKGQGSSTRATDYTRTDAGIGAKAAGLVYYRLKQVDVDGTTTFSPVRTVSFGKVVPAITLYPNPATSATSLDLTLLPTGAYRVSVLDAAGRVVLNTTLEAGLTHALDLNTIASGTYTLLVRGENGGQVVNLTKRLIKE
jgi:hypothetical protein